MLARCFDAKDHKGVTVTTRRQQVQEKPSAQADRARFEYSVADKTKMSADWTASKQRIKNTKRRGNIKMHNMWENTHPADFDTRLPNNATRQLRSFGVKVILTVTFGTGNKFQGTSAVTVLPCGMHDSIAEAVVRTDFGCLAPICRGQEFSYPVACPWQAQNNFQLHGMLWQYPGEQSFRRRVR